MERSGFLILFFFKKKSLQITTPASNVDRFNFPNMGGERLLKLAPVHATTIFLLLVYFFKTCSHYTVRLVYVTEVLLNLEM